MDRFCRTPRDTLEFALTGVTEERKRFRGPGANPSIGTGFGAEITRRAFLFIEMETAAPGKGGLRTGLQARL